MKELKRLKELKECLLGCVSEYNPEARHKILDIKSGKKCNDPKPIVSVKFKLSYQKVSGDKKISFLMT